MSYKNPPILVDLLQLYKLYYKNYQNFPKIFRVTMGKDIFTEIKESLRLITHINWKKESNNDWQSALSDCRLLRTHIELLRSYFFFAMEIQVLSQGQYLQYLERIEKLSKQSVSWYKWIHQKTRL